MRDCGRQQSNSAACCSAGIPAIPTPGHYTTPVRKDIRILNPVADHGFTSLKRALRFINQGRAEWVKHGVSIRFVNGNHKHASAQQSVNATRYWYERAVDSGIASY